MTPEERKIYNNKYYANKKVEILNKLQTKIECPLCGRHIAHQNSQTHLKSKICLSRRGIHKLTLKLMKDMDKLKNDTEET